MRFCLTAKKSVKKFIVIADMTEICQLYFTAKKVSKTAKGLHHWGKYANFAALFCGYQNSLQH